MIFDKIKEIVVEQLGVNEEEITMESSFTGDLGADSLDIFQIVMAIEEEYGIDVAENDTDKIKTVGDAIRYIESKMDN
ncbi:MAG: acyl carrier protein [Clostridiales bacterium GWE2_32_10]|nr:MAG: acyl carrier protein [Clostridiales bacterium GWE2_32_10]HBY20823.1 acyl carrier protein [Clostridiales bacterium]